MTLFLLHSPLYFASFKIPILVAIVQDVKHKLNSETGLRLYF